MTNSRSIVSVPGFVLAIWLSLFSVQGVAAHQATAFAKRAAGKTLICSTGPDGQQHCTEKLNTGVIAAIVVVTILVIAVFIGIGVFVYHMRRQKGDDVENQSQLSVEASQMQGPPPIIGVTAIPSSRKRGKKNAAQLVNTTYAANYDPSSAPVLPQLAYAAGSAPVLSMRDGGPPSAPIAARMGLGSAYGYGPGSAGAYTPPQTAPNGKAFGKGQSPYPFVGISSTQLPPMPHGGPSYASGGYGNRI
jgi:hypothetical protein